MHPSLRRKLRLSVLSLFCVCLILGVYGVFIEPFTLKIKEWTVETGKWQGQKELRIALLSDLHMIWPWMTPEHLARVVERTNELKPDIVLLLGDYVGDHFFGFQLNPEEGLAPLVKLSAPCGIFSVVGNHDLKQPTNGKLDILSVNPAGWLEALVKTSIPLLVNKARHVTCGKNQFWVIGIGDHPYDKERAAETLKQVTNGQPIIMMMHNPGSFADTPVKVALSVAGHTHGGQVRIPFYGAVASVIPSKYGLRYVYGHVREGQKDLVVTSGLGMTGLPIRFLTPPEISLVTLKSIR